MNKPYCDRDPLLPGADFFLSVGVQAGGQI